MRGDGEAPPCLVVRDVRVRVQGSASRAAKVKTSEYMRNSGLRCSESMGWGSVDQGSGLLDVDDWKDAMVEEMAERYCCIVSGERCAEWRRMCVRYIRYRCRVVVVCKGPVVLMSLRQDDARWLGASKPWDVVKLRIKSRALNDSTDSAKA